LPAALFLLLLLLLLLAARSPSRTLLLAVPSPYSSAVAPVARMPLPG
jgi:hypothetical protein